MTALALAKQGFAVAVNYSSNRDAAIAVQKEIQSARGRAEIIQADVSVAQDRQRLVDQTLAAFGRIDLLVNNAGVAPTTRADLLEATEESFDRLININLKGPYFLTQLVARRMIEQQTPAKIINITSISAYTASINRAEYCISKAGLAMSALLFAQRLAPRGILVFEIRPGIIRTDMIAAVEQQYEERIAGGLLPQRRMGEPADIGKAVRAIADGLLDYAAGQVLNLDGGFHMRGV